MFCDNLDALYIAKTLVFHERTKNIEVDFHYVCDVLSTRLISLQHISTTHQLGDVLTKALTCVPHHKFGEAGCVPTLQLWGVEFIY